MLFSYLLRDGAVSIFSTFSLSFFFSWPHPLHHHGIIFSTLFPGSKKIKGSLSSSWMNSPIPSLHFPLWQNKSLCETIRMKIYVTCIFIRIKIKSFSCETISTSTRSKKEANGNSEVEVKSAYVPSGPLGQHLFQFL